MATPASIRFFNPGAMYPGPSASNYGSTGYEIIGGGHKIAKFPDAESGAAAHFDLLSRRYSGLPLDQAITKWSGGNSSPAYVQHIAKATGLAPNAVLTPELLNDPQKAVALAKAQAQWEAGQPYPLDDAGWMRAHARATGGAPALPPLSILDPDTGQPKTAAPQPTQQPMAAPQPQGQKMAEPTFLDSINSNPLFQQGLGLFLASSQGKDMNQGLSAGMDRAQSAQQQQMRADAEKRRLIQENAIKTLLSNPNALAGTPEALREIARVTGDVGPINQFYSKANSTEFGKQGTIIQDAQGKFYAVQFNNKGETKYHPLQAPGGAAASGVIGENGAAMSAPLALQPARGTEKIGGVIRDKATGRPIANVEEDIASGKKAEKVGTEQGDFVARFPKLESALSGWERQADNTNMIIERAKRTVDEGGQRVAGWGGVLSNIPSTDARKLRNDLETIKANIGFDKLQAMREASPTGGALGAISDMENKLLQAVQGALDQMDDPQALSASLGNIQSMLQALKVERRAAFKADVERFGGSAKPQGGAPGGIPSPQPKRRRFNPATGELE